MTLNNKKMPLGKVIARLLLYVVVFDSAGSSLLCGD